MNLNLKLKILERGMTQLEISRSVGVSDGYLSKVVQGWVEPTADLKSSLAKILNCAVSDIFHLRIRKRLSL